MIIIIGNDFNCNRISCLLFRSLSGVTPQCQYMYGHDCFGRSDCEVIAYHEYETESELRLGKQFWSCKHIKTGRVL